MKYRDIIRYDDLKYKTVKDLDQVKAWSILLNENISYSNVYCNPTRYDKNPGCKFYNSPDGTLLLIDFSKKTGMDVVQAYMKVHNLGYLDAFLNLWKLTMRSINFTSNFPTISLKKQDYKTGIYIVEKQIDNQYFEFWSKFNLFEEDLNFINSDGIEYKTLYIDNYTVNTHILETGKESSKTRFCSNYDIGFAYISSEFEGAKLYFPFRTKKDSLLNKPRFISSLNENEVFVDKKDSNFWIVTKSHKDFFVLRKIIKELRKENLLKWDYSLTHTQNEGSIPDKFKDWPTACRLITLFDNDKSGIEFSDKFRSQFLNAQCEFIPVQCGKDISEMVACFGYDKAKQFVLEILNK